MATNEYLVMEQSLGLHGTAHIHGAKNAVLVIMASLILTQGKSLLRNVPYSDDVQQMIKLLRQLGADVSYFADTNVLEVDTSTINNYTVSHEIMKKMRASILVMGPLLARFGKAHIALPGGCAIGTRPINYHLNNFAKMGVDIEIRGDFLQATALKLFGGNYPLEYPSVGATENIMMAALFTRGITRIINAALEPEVLDLIDILRKMGAHITILPPATIEIEGIDHLKPVEHTIMHDRLETGSLLLATAITRGQISIPYAPAFAMDVFLMKLQEMGHSIEIGLHGVGIVFKASQSPRAVSLKTAPYPGFPTDLQAPMMVAQCLAEGTSIIEETVFENRLLHVRELQKMGAQVQVEHNKAIINGVEELYGTQVIASDIRASAALVCAGLAAKGSTIMSGIHHWKRGYDSLEVTLASLGAKIDLKIIEDDISDQDMTSYVQMTPTPLN